MSTRRQQLVEALRAEFGDKLMSLILAHDEVTLEVAAEDLLEVATTLRDNESFQFQQLVDLCGVDYLEFMDRSLPDGVVRERFEVVVNLLDLSSRRRTRIRVQVPESNPVIASLFDLYPGSEAMERECFDMFGIEFTDHPDLTRILMPEDWEGHPLRKDYEVGRIPVQFKGANA